MRKHIKIALIYAILAMIGGVFFREFTKAFDFTGATALGKLHTHLFILGMVMFFIVGLSDDKLNLSQSKLYKPFMIVYNIGVGLMCVMLTVRGVTQVIGAKVSDGAIAGVPGISHIVVAAGMILFFIMLLKLTKKQEQ